MHGDVQQFIITNQSLILLVIAIFYHVQILTMHLYNIAKSLESIFNLEFELQPLKKLKMDGNYFQKREYSMSILLLMQAEEQVSSTLVKLDMKN